jgi:Rps23 Pro-64 3,4-dihydroxylase Tpa1-like proline 4-hydroxylase
MKGPFPPYRLYDQFLNDEERVALLDWTLSKEDSFQDSRLVGGTLDLDRRKSKVSRDLGPLQKMIETRVREVSPEIFSALGVRPFGIELVELELAAHLDGAHFAPHTDIPVGPGRQPLGGDGSGRFERLVSCVYYFHKEPKRFSGGELRLHRFGSTEEEDMTDISPQQNMLVAFPSWVIHEVKKVSCPSGRFENARFAVNCWICRGSAEAA